MSSSCVLCINSIEQGSGELIIPQLFEVVPKTLWNTRVQNCAHKKHTSFYLRSILIFLELELNAGGAAEDWDLN